MKTIASINFCILLLIIGHTAKSQLTINSGATFNIQSGGLVVVQGDVTSNSDITGVGTLSLKGSAIQNINMNGFAVSNLVLDNVANANITGAAKFSSSVTFTNGKLILGNNNVTLAATETNSSMASGKFFETNGTGVVKKELTADISNYTIPIGNGSNYMPISITNTGSTYSNASIAVQVKGTVSNNKHIRTETYLNTTWPITKTGITGGTTNAVATYIDPANVVGTEADLKGFYWNGSDWSLAGGNQNTTSNTIAADITSNSGELYGMNKFVLLDSKAFLQGPYNSGTGLMNDNLRTTATYVPGNAPTGNLIPSTDPYRTATYSTAFAHINNATNEVVTATAFNDMTNANDNIVDWVFLELRSNITPGNTVLQTRSALLQRDGDIVDIDGVSPIYFKNVDPANYTITVRHRNHLGMASNPAVFNQPLNVFANVAKLNFTSTASSGNFMGTAGNNYFNNGTALLMYAGDANINRATRYSGAGNDRAIILTDIGNVETSSVTGYFKSDLNLNRVVRYSGAGNDRAVILSAVLLNSETASKSQAIIP